MGDVTDLDLDIYNECKRIHGNDKTSIFYFRNHDKKTTVGFSGADTNLASGFVACLKKYPELYDILDTALAVYEENYV